MMLSPALHGSNAYDTSINTEESIIRQLYSDLKDCPNLSDSIHTLENIADLTDVSSRTDVLDDIYGLSLKSGDYAKACDVLRKQANINSRNDSILLSLLDRTLQLPKSADTRETETFIRMARTTRKLLYGTPVDKQARLNELLERLTMQPPEDLYDKIFLLHAICAYVSDSSQGELLSKYMDAFGQLVDKLPENSYSIRNVYNIQASLAYTENEEPEKAVEADKRLLASIDSLEAMYRREGRIYRDFDAHRFVIYTRILSNYESLSDSEIEEYYSKAKRIASTNKRAGATYKLSPQSEIYYAMHKKDYPKALALLKSCIDNEYQKPKRRLLLRLMTEAAKETGDQEALLKASTDYNDILEEYLDKKYQERYKELEVIYNIHEIKEEFAQLQIDKQELENSLQRKIIIIICLSCLFMAAFIAILLYLNKKSRRLAKTLSESNAALKVESENLRRLRSESNRSRDQALKANSLKSDFIKNMSREVNVPLQAITEYSGLIVDCADSSHKQYLERFCRMVELNSELLSTMVNDMLSLADLESSSSAIVVNRKAVNLYDLCNMAVDTTKHRVSSGVVMCFNPDGQPDLSLYTDPQRVQQILINLLLNAAKFTSEGSIVLMPKLSDDKSHISFIVEDTGIGIPAERKDLIFERFYKLNSESQGAGLGLTISRMLASLLGGTLDLDTSYEKGARFVLTIPVTDNN